MSGQIDLEYPFVASWLWETEPDTIWVSMVMVAKEAQNKGHTSKLIDNLLTKYKKVIVPNPSNTMLHIIKKRGFQSYPDYDPSADVYDTWIWIKEWTESERSEEQ